VIFLIDTDILTLFFEGHVEIDRRFRSVGSGDSIATTVVSQIQILRGRHEFLLKAANGDELMRARKWLAKSEMDLASIRIVQLDESAAAEFDKLLKGKSLRKIGRGDILIACIALANKATLITRNLKDFKLVRDLDYRLWFLRLGCRSLGCLRFHYGYS